MSSSVGMMTFPTEWKTKSHVPNHQSGSIPMKSPFSQGFPMKSPFSHGFPMVFQPPTSNPPPKNQVTRWSKSSPPKWVSPLVATHLKDAVVNGQQGHIEGASDAPVIQKDRRLREIYEEITSFNGQIHYQRAIFNSYNGILITSGKHTKKLWKITFFNWFYEL